MSKRPEQPYPTGNLIFLGALVCSLAALDYYVHLSGLESDPVRRATAYKTFGPIVRHIGNFALASSMTTVLVLSKKIVERTDTTPYDQTTFDKALDAAYTLGLAGIFAMIIASEAFPGNTGAFQDILVSLLGISLTRETLEESLHNLRIYRHRGLPSKLDNIFTTSPTPTFLHQVGTRADQIFPQ